FGGDGEPTQGRDWAVHMGYPHGAVCGAGGGVGADGKGGGIMTAIDTKRLFDTIRGIKGATLSQADVDAVNAVLNAKPRCLSDPATFFAGVRKVTGVLDQQQVDIINRLLVDASHWGIGWLAYGLATAWH